MPMSSHELAELKWENGQLAMHEFGGIFPCAPTNCKVATSTWEKSSDTLESVVHRATICNKEGLGNDQVLKNVGSVVASSGGRGAVVGEINGLLRKRTRSDSDHYSQSQRKFCSEDEWADPSVCGSANATFGRDNDTSMTTWASYESSRSTRTKTTDENSACCNGGSENQKEGKATKSDTERSHSTRKGRAAAVHNQSERRRRDRINQKMKALQKLVPNASKTDKASMLDEVIEYLKQLQAQVQMMSARNMSQHIMMPLGMQQQLQMAILAPASMGVGLGMGMGMLNMSNVAHASSAPHHLASLIHPAPPVATNASTFVSPPLIVPPIVSSSAAQQAKPDHGNSSLAPLPDPYNTFLGQPMSMEMYNRMAAIYRQQMSQSANTSSHMQLNPLQGS